jgi:hypothetical protein
MRSPHCGEVSPILIEVVRPFKQGRSSNGNGKSSFSDIRDPSFWLASTRMGKEAED